MNRIEELENLIKNYSQSYYSGESEVDDEYFDSLVEELRSLDPDSEVINKTGWGFEPQGRKVSHLYNLKVGSLSKVKNPESIPSRFTPSFCRFSAKLDGLSVVSYYNRGHRVKSITRGNGTQGLDVTDKINVISPKTEVLSYDFTGAVRGEVLMSVRNWREVKEKRFSDNPSANPRNFSSGVLNREELTDDLKLLDYIVYKVVADPMKAFRSSFSETLDFKKMSEFLLTEFNCVPYVTLNNTQFSHEILKEEYDKFNLEYPCDGVVITRMDDINYNDSIVDYDEVAYKFESESREVVVTGVDWNATRTGRMMPRVWFDPVELSGALVRKSTGFNAAFIRDNKINVGTVIKVTRSGEVIPHILEIVDNPCNEGLLPQVCPNCGSDLRWDGVDLVCDSENEDQLIYRFISTAGGVEGAGWSLYSKLIEALNLKDYQTFLEFLSDLNSNFESFENQINNKISGSVTKSKCISILNNLRSEIKPGTFLVACNVGGLSWKSAQNLIDNYPEYISDLKSNTVDYDRMWSINGFGSSIIKTLQNFQNRLFDIASRVNVASPTKTEIKEVKFSVAITGALSMKRSEFDAILESHGYSQSSNFKEIKYLITNNPDSTSSKMKKAKDNNVEIISEKEFFEKFLK